MKKLAFIGALMFILLSCKCKKDVAVTELKEDNSKEKVENQEPKHTMTLPKNSLVTRTKVNENENQEKGISVEYEALSRGYFLKIVYRGNSISVGKDRNDLSQNKTIKLSSQEENELNQMIAKFDPKTLPNLKWPTEKRYYDGAPHANLVIVKDGETYTGAGFDHGFPPKEIEKLVQKLISIAEKD
jgi:hypothetical protein